MGGELEVPCGGPLEVPGGSSEGLWRPQGPKQHRTLTQNSRLAHFSSQLASSFLSFLFFRGGHWGSERLK